MQEKTLLNQANSTSNIHSMDFGAIFYDIFGSPYQKTGSFLADDSLDFGYLGKPYFADTELYDYGFRDYSPEIARFTTIDPIRDGRNWYSYVVNDPVNYVDLWGLWESKGDGSFIAQEGDTLLELQEETGIALESFEYLDSKDSLEIGQVVYVVKPPVNNNYVTIDTTNEAVDHYYNGNGEPVNLGENTVNTLKNSPEQKFNQKALRDGTAKSTITRYGVNLTDYDGTYHVGDTVVTYEKSEGTKYRVVTYNAFVSDGFWDIFPGEGDKEGKKKELPGGNPYPYITYTWTEVYNKCGVD